MVIIVTSDSHGKKDILKSVYEKYPKADYYLDAGDSECYEEEIEPFLTVKGNCDYKIDTRFRIVEAGDLKIFLFHGDRALLSLEALHQRAVQAHCNMIIHGHTHMPHYSFYNGVHIVCPGSVSLPRTRDGRTYAIIKVDGNEVNVEFEKVERWKM